MKNIAARYGVKVPTDVLALYQKKDGEREGAHPWRFHTVAEMLALPLDEWLRHSPEAAWIGRLGGLLPLVTNDNSDLLVVHCGGPLDGRLSLVLHDDPAIRLAFRSLRSFLSARRDMSFGDTNVATFDYRAQEPPRPTAAARKADETAATALERALAAHPDDGARDWVAANVALLRPQVTSGRAAELWPYNGFIAQMIVGPGCLVTTRGSSNEAMLWDSRSGKPRPVAIAAKRDHWTSVALSEDRKALHAVVDGVAYEWPLDQKTAKKRRLGPATGATEILGSRNGRLIALSRADSSVVQVWKNDKLEREIAAQFYTLGDVVLSRDGTRATIVIRNQRKPQLWVVDLHAGKKKWQLALDAEGCCATWSDGDAAVAYGTADGAIGVVDAKTGKKRVAIAANTTGDAISSVMFGPDNTLWATCESDDTLRTFSITSRKELAQVQLARPTILAQAPEGLLYVALNFGGIARFRVDARGALARVR